MDCILMNTFKNMAIKQTILKINVEVGNMLCS